MLKKLELGKKIFKICQGLQFINSFSDALRKLTEIAALNLNVTDWTW